MYLLSGWLCKFRDISRRNFSVDCVSRYDSRRSMYMRLSLFRYDRFLGSGSVFPRETLLITSNAGPWLIRQGCVRQITSYYVGILWKLWEAQVDCAAEDHIWLIHSILMGKRRLELIPTLKYLSAPNGKSHIIYGRQFAWIITTREYAVSLPVLTSKSPPITV